MMKNIFLLAFMTYLLGSCSADSLDSNTACVALSVASISVSGNQSSTRSTSLADGTSIGISRIADAIYTAQSNFKYVNTVNVWSAANSANKIVLAGNSNVTLCAYSPYSSSIDITAIPLTSGLYSISSDFCYGYKSGVNATNMGAGVSFSLNHAYAKLTLHFTKGATFSGTGNVKKITVAGGAFSATLNLSSASSSTSNRNTGTPVTVGDGISIIFNTVTSTTYDVELLMVPTSLSSGLIFTINVDGLDKIATLSASLLSELVANTNYTIPIEISQAVLDLGGATGTNYVSITDWIIPSSVANPLADFYTVQPESNSYMVSPSATIYIPVSRATTGNAANFSSIASFTCGLLWSSVSTTHVTVTAIGRFIKVVASSTEGNSVVYAKNTNGDIVWSWHIWVTSYNGGTFTYNSRQWMLRNLGAGASTSWGLYYQWGRKDPFPSGAGTSTSSGATVQSETVAADPNLINSIQHPLTFYSGSNWYSNSTNRDDNLWGGVSKTKTIYDPCPIGWKIPVGGIPGTTGYPWNGIGGSNFLWTSSGRSYNGWFYPAAGYLSNSTGVWTKNESRYWCGVATTSSNNAYNLLFTVDVMNAGRNHSRAYGHPVRCVKE